jgi:hypothetical protein
MLSEVQVVSGTASSAARAAGARHLLQFPEHWQANPACNPAEAAITFGTIGWLNASGIGLGPAGREKLRKFECGKYGGYSLPRAPLDEALLVTQYISLWLFWDDVEVEDHADWNLDDVVTALTTGTSRSSSRYVAAWADLGRRLGARRDRAWLERLALSMREWLENAKVETRLAKRLREQDVWPELGTAFDCRTVSIGMYPTFYLIELAEGIELPDSFHAHPEVTVLKRLASRLVGMGNDLGGLAKDIANHWLNLVIVQAHASSLDLEAAFSRIVTLHNREVLEFDHAASRLPSFGTDLDRAVERWVAGVRYSVYGFALWESVAERYQEFTVVFDERPLLASVSGRGQGQEAATYFDGFGAKGDRTKRKPRL